jgi:hypothetical protein
MGYDSTSDVGLVLYEDSGSLPVYNTFKLGLEHNGEKVLASYEFKMDSAYNLYLDDSTNMKKYLTTDTFTNKTMFFLDAHVDNTNIHNYRKKCPLFDELDAIKSIHRKDNVILIDDLRIIRNSFPWGETSYGDIDFLQQIKDTILTINKEYKFHTLDGDINDDVLLAYV